MVATARTMTRRVLDQEFELQRAALRFHCYQMLGSLADAEDVVQDTYGRAIDASERFEGRSSIKTWLFRIATHACIDELRRRKRRGLISTRRPNGREDERPEDLELEHWIEPFPDALLPDRKYAAVEAVTLAFVAALQYLSPRQRAVIVLRDSLDWSADEVAALLEMTTAAVHAALLRARATIKERRGRERSHSAPDLATARAFAVAFERRDVTTLATMLQRDVALHMPPFQLWLEGLDATLAFLQRRIWAGRDLEVTLSHANGRIAAVLVDRAAGGAPFAVVVLERSRRNRIQTLHAFVMPHVVPYFLP